MKRFAFVCFSLILSTAVLAPIAQAQENSPYNTTPQPVDTPASSSRVIRELSPFDLASLAYQGYFSEQGIPGFGNFVLQLNTRRITADTLMQAAVDAGRLSPETQNSRHYRTALQAHLLSLRNSIY